MFHSFESFSFKRFLSRLCEDYKNRELVLVQSNDSNKDKDDSVVSPVMNNLERIQIRQKSSFISG